MSSKRKPVISSDLPDDFTSVLVLACFEGKWLMVKNKNRNWEFPGGHREPNETPEQTARREAHEEAGALIHQVQLVGHYRLPSGHTTLIAKCAVERLIDLPAGFETLERKLVDSLPKDLSFKDGVYELLWQKFCRAGIGR